jgi:hypothetical protein
MAESTCSAPAIDYYLLAVDFHESALARRHVWRSGVWGRCSNDSSPIARRSLAVEVTRLIGVATSFTRKENDQIFNQTGGE